MGVNKITAFNFAQEDNLSIDRDKLKEKLITIKVVQENRVQFRPLLKSRAFVSLKIPQYNRKTRRISSRPKKEVLVIWR